MKERGSKTTEVSVAALVVNDVSASVNDVSKTTLGFFLRGAGPFDSEIRHQRLRRQISRLLEVGPLPLPRRHPPRFKGSHKAKHHLGKLFPLLFRQYGFHALREHFEGIVRCPSETSQCNRTKRRPEQIVGCRDRKVPKNQTQCPTWPTNLGSVSAVLCSRRAGSWPPLRWTPSGCCARRSPHRQPGRPATGN